MENEELDEEDIRKKIAKLESKEKDLNEEELNAESDIEEEDTLSDKEGKDVEEVEEKGEEISHLKARPSPQHYPFREIRCGRCGSRQVYTLVSGVRCCRKCGFKE